MTTQKTFKITTLGCRTNQYESQAYADQLKALGYREAQKGELAEVCIVNTCTVTESADRSSRHEIRQLAREHPTARLVVTGCLAERAPEEMRALPGVSQLVPNKEKEQLMETLFPEEELPEFAIREFASHTRAFVKVQDGCNSFCTYCIIPYVRGRSRSRSLLEILQEVKTLVHNGYKEVVLTGINIGDFDGAPASGEKPLRLADLVKAVDQVEGIERVRISSIDPDEVDEELLKAVLEGKHTCPSMHIVLQSGSNVVLKRMNRKYTRQNFLESIERLVQACPDFTVTTDVIVGFPGETERDFQETLEVMQKVQFAKVHMFPYSERKKTRAALFPGKIAPQVIDQRKRELLHVAERSAFELRNRFLGRKMGILLENREEEGEFFGHTSNFLPVFVTSSLPLRSNQLIEVDLVENTPQGLRGRVI